MNRSLSIQISLPLLGCLAISGVLPPFGLLPARSETIASEAVEVTPVYFPDDKTHCLAAGGRSSGYGNGLPQLAYKPLVVDVETPLETLFAGKPDCVEFFKERLQDRRANEYTIVGTHYINDSCGTPFWIKVTRDDAAKVYRHQYGAYIKRCRGLTQHVALVKIPKLPAGYSFKFEQTPIQGTVIYDCDLRRGKFRNPCFELPW